MQILFFLHTGDVLASHSGRKFETFDNQSNSCANRGAGKIPNSFSFLLHYDKCKYCFIQEFNFKTTTIKLCNITTSGITGAQLCNGKHTCLPPLIPHSHYTWYLTGL